MDRSVQSSIVGNLLERVTALEKRERNHADEMRNLERENRGLRKRVERTEKKYDKLKEKFESIQRSSSGNKPDNRYLQMMETICKQQPMILNLDKMAKVLNKAMLQSHQKPPVASKGISPLLEKQVAGLLKWKDERVTHDNNMVERIRSVAKETGSIDAMQDQLSMLLEWKDENEDNVKKMKSSIEGINKWKVEKDASDKLMSTRWEDAVKKISSNFSAIKGNLDEKTKTQDNATAMPKQLQDQLAKTVLSIFCADLVPCQPLGTQQGVVKINRCTSAYSSNNGPFDSKTGTFRTQHDGAYNLGWKIHQKGDGKIRYIMAIDGMQGRIYLGHTDEAGDICSGTMVVPLKKEQRVWIEAKRVAGPDAQVYGCNFMGWLMELNSFDSLETITSLQQNLFSSIVNECQHL